MTCTSLIATEGHRVEENMYSKAYNHWKTYLSRNFPS